GIDEEKRSCVSERVTVRPYEDDDSEPLFGRVVGTVRGTDAEKTRPCEIRDFAQFIAPRRHNGRRNRGLHDPASHAIGPEAAHGRVGASPSCAAEGAAHGARSFGSWPMPIARAGRWP